jgi:hypothetical protein
MVFLMRGEQLAKRLPVSTFVACVGMKSKLRARHAGAEPRHISI